MKLWGVQKCANFLDHPVHLYADRPMHGPTCSRITTCYISDFCVVASCRCWLWFPRSPVLSPTSASDSPHRPFNYDGRSSVVVASPRQADLADSDPADGTSGPPDHLHDDVAADHRTPVADDQRRGSFLSMTWNPNGVCGAELHHAAAAEKTPLLLRPVALHRRLNAVVRDRIVFFTKKDRSTSAKS